MYPNIITLVLFCIAAGFTPGPNNILGSYQGFNFGIKKTIPHILSVTLGFTSLVLFDLKNIFYVCIWAFFWYFINMEIIINSPSFYLHIQDAVIVLQACIDGILHFATQIKI